MLASNMTDAACPDGKWESDKIQTAYTTAVASFSYPNQEASHLQLDTDKRKLNKGCNRKGYLFQSSQIPLMAKVTKGSLRG